jgi:hypothetical protein
MSPGRGVGWRLPGCGDGPLGGGRRPRTVRHQEFSYASPCGEYCFLQDYTTEVRGVHLKIVVTVTFNDDGQAEDIVVSHRRSALLFLSRTIARNSPASPESTNAEKRSA